MVKTSILAVILGVMALSVIVFADEADGAGTDGIDGAVGPMGPIGLTGPAGADGTNGLPGAMGPSGILAIYSVIASPLSIPAFSPPTLVVATCDVGAPGPLDDDFATGGGYILGSPDLIVISTSAITPSEWAVSVINPNATAANVMVTVQCADITP